MNIRFLAIILAALGIVVAPAAAQTPAPMHTPKSVHLNYSCHNLKVPVTYDNVKDRALITYGARRYTLPRVMSADGARYMNDELEWWEKGQSATLSSVTGGKADTVLATCDAVVKK